MFACVAWGEVGEGKVFEFFLPFQASSIDEAHVGEELITCCSCVGG